MFAATGALAVTDADAVDTPTFVQQTGTPGVHGNFDITSSGNWTYTLDNAANQQLAQGEVITETFTVTAITADGESTTETVTVTVTGTNDAPTVSTAITDSGNEDGAASAIDMLQNASDVDNDAVLNVANVSALPGWAVRMGNVLNIDPPDSFFQSLNVGDSHALTVTYDVEDQHGASVPQTLSVTIHGTNDAPTVSAAVTATTDEDQTLITADLLTHASDADAGAVMSIVGLTQTTGRSVIPTIVGSQFQIDPSGFQDLDDGESEDLVFSYTIEDEHGASVPQTVTITVEGRNDAPTATAISVTTDEDALPGTIDLLATADDVDTNDVLSAITGVQVEVVYGLEANDEIQMEDSDDFYMHRAGDVTFKRRGTDENDLWLDLGNGEGVLIVDALSNSTTQTVESFAFADGTVLSVNDIRDILLANMPTNGADVVNAWYTDDTIAGGTGDDLLRGRDGADTYQFAAGDGSDVIEGDGYLDTDRLEITGYASTDAVITQVQNDGDDVVIDFGNGDRILTRNTLLESNSDHIEEIYFAGDGVTLTMADIRDLFLTQSQTSGDDIIIAPAGNFDQTITGGLGNDYIEGHYGNDTYIFNAGDGCDRFFDSGGAHNNDVLDIRGYSSTDAPYSYSPGATNDVVISFAGGDQIYLANSLTESAQDHVEQIIIMATASRSPWRISVPSSLPPRRQQDGTRLSAATWPIRSRAGWAMTY